MRGGNKAANFKSKLHEDDEKPDKSQDLQVNQAHSDFDQSQIIADIHADRPVSFINPKPGIKWKLDQNWTPFYVFVRYYAVKIKK